MRTFLKFWDSLTPLFLWDYAKLYANVCIEGKFMPTDLRNEEKNIYITVIWNSCNTLLKNHAISYEIQHVALAFKAAFNCIKHNLHQQDSFFFLNVNIFNIFYDTCPDYMKENFFRLSNLHRNNTRGSNFNFHVPRIKTHSSGSFFL